MEGKETIVFWPLNSFFPNLFAEGPIDINMSEIGMDYVHELFSKDPTLELGGHWKPSDCMPRWKVGCGVRLEVLGSPPGTCRPSHGIHSL